MMPRKTGPLSFHTQKPPLYEVRIDFDAASKAWKKNKHQIGNGEYEYRKKKKRKRS